MTSEALIQPPGSGLRRNGLRQLAIEHLDTEHSVLRLGTFTRIRQALFHPLPRDLVERLQAHAVSGEPNRVYMSRCRDEVPRDVPKSPLLYVRVGTARDLAHDLTAAGIPLVTEHGKAVFHSLRIMYINLVLDLGVNPKEAQQLARHPTVNLTMKVYGRARSEYLSAVVERLYESVCANDVQVGELEEPLPLVAVRDAGMPKGGFEPPRLVRHHPLKMACLPFPPLRHIVATGNGFQTGQERQHSACSQSLSTALSDRLRSVCGAIGLYHRGPQAPAHFRPAGLLRERLAVPAPLIGRSQPAPDP